MTDQSRGESRGRTSSDRMLSVMDLFTPERPEWTVDEACAALGQSESTVYRYFRSLTAAGLIFSIRPGRYLLGPGIVHYDRQLRTSDPLLRAAEPILLEVAAEYSGPGLLFVSRIYRDYVMTMHEQRLGAEAPPEGVFARGRLAPMFRGAPALAILAFLEVRAVRAMYQRTHGDEGFWLETKRLMRAIRAQGYAVGIDDPDIGVIHVSVPLKQEAGGVAGSLSLALPSSEHDEAAIEHSARRLAVAADRMGQQARITARD
jgi:DNA-binding IclR family transcriptional regulator